MTLIFQLRIGTYKGNQVYMSNLTFEQVAPTELQIEVLYRLLGSREHSISHVELPSYEEHSYFVSNHPYRCWYLIISDTVVVGSVYVQFDNSVGIVFCPTMDCEKLDQVIYLVKEAIQPLEAIPSLRYKDFYFNVPYADEKHRKCLQELGYVPMQISYVTAKP